MAHRGPLQATSSLPGLLAPLFVALCLTTAVGPTPVLGDVQTHRIQIDYVMPDNPAHEQIYKTLKDERALEKLQEIFSPFKLPVSLTLKTAGCQGSVNAWYWQQVVLVCYEYIEAIHKNLPQDPKSEITPTDAMIGQFFYVFAHEMGHAVYDVLNVPLLGKLEDAADQFATFIMLQFGRYDARRLIMGAAYSYSEAVKNPTVAESLQAFDNEHGLAQQRFFNLLCLAYGADSQTFGDLVSRGYLLQSRADSCRRAYGELRYAFVKLIEPNVDMNLARGVLQKEWLPDAPKNTR